MKDMSQMVKKTSKMHTTSCLKYLNLKQNMKLTKKIKVLMKNLDKAQSRLIFEMKKNEQLEMYRPNSTPIIVLLKEGK